MIKFRIDVEGIALTVERLRQRKGLMEQAVVNSLNKTGSAVLDALKAEMPSAFDRPTQYTLNSLRLYKATRTRMVARIIPAEFAGKGTPAAKYLGPEIFGGDRRVKRSEKALRASGVLPDVMFTVPGRGANLDAYGNQSQGELRQVLSYFKSAEERLGYLANMTDKTRARLARGSKKTGFGFSYFAIRSNRGNLAPGIYRRMNFAVGQAIKPILMFVKQPIYTKRYRWFEVAGTVARHMFEHYLKRELTGSWPVGTSSRNR